MKIQCVAALLCLLMFLHSEGKYRGRGHYRGWTKGHYRGLTRGHYRGWTRGHYRGLTRGHYRGWTTRSHYTSSYNGQYEHGGKRYYHHKYKSQGNSPNSCEAPCKSLPTTCPDGYTKLFDQTVSQNCYLFGGNTTLNFTSWHVALARCLNTPGAYLWIPETPEEAEAVRVKFNIKDGVNGLDTSNGCFELEFKFYENGTAFFSWDSDTCGEESEAYICEFPIVSLN
ncbi:unnamed protein product [Mytilus edulis]|uniref:C-type lectin domain-containing protein n=1 Tax=Mytilus edulis TaxID=6550 RepID=A0A8S3S3S2_MYTED|nr:unnamed protein product [Mytilus edulis]